ncbi:MAG: N-acetylmuramoyl-L-alanine amidase [Elainellaceae cyanobacterium]
MRFRGLMPSVLGSLAVLLLALPAEAARLQFWRFDSAENRLTFTTDSSIRPRAQLIQNPTRVVIDLPGVTLANTLPSQLVGGAIREVRVGQFNAQTTRLVIELNPGYTLDPQQVLVEGVTPTQWFVNLPQPQRIEDAGAIAQTPSIPTPELISDAGEAVVAGAATRLDGVRVTRDGLFLQTVGAVPEIDIDRSRDRERLTLEIENTSLSTQVPESFDINQFGVDRIEFEQADDDPPTVEVTLRLDDEDTNWQATATNLGGIALVPTATVDAAGRDNRPRTSIAQRPVSDSEATPVITTIESVELANNGTSLIIRGDESIRSYTSGWDRATTDYQIVIPNARLAEAIANPQIPDGGPLLRIRLREENNSVVVSLLPAAGVQLGNINQPSQQLLALSMQGNAVAAPGFSPDSPITLPNVNSRVVVVIDPGHGGRDPGAIGIGGLRETNVVLPVSARVANLLQQQGVAVVMTRSTEQTVSLEGRVQIAERANAALFVSIHANAISMSRPDVNGIETYYASSQGLALAQSIHNSLLQAVGGPDRGVRQARFYVIRRTSMPASLVETGFVTGARDAPLLRDPAYQERVAQAIARGILQYIQQRY